MCFETDQKCEVLVSSTAIHTLLEDAYHCDDEKFALPFAHIPVAGFRAYFGRYDAHA